MTLQTYMLMPDMGKLTAMMGEMIDKLAAGEITEAELCLCRFNKRQTPIFLI